MQVTGNPAQTALAKLGIAWFVIRKGLVCCPRGGSDWLLPVMLLSLNRSLRPYQVWRRGPLGHGAVVSGREIPGCWDWKKDGKASGSTSSLPRCLHPRLEAFVFAHSCLGSPGPLQCFVAFPVPTFKALPVSSCLLRRPCLTISALSINLIITPVSTCMRFCAQGMFQAV